MSRITISFKGRNYPKAITLQSVSCYVAYALSYRDIEELMQERGIDIDHATIQRWVVEYSSKLEKAFRQRKRLTGNSLRIDATYIKTKGYGNICIAPWINRGKRLTFY